jgi:hypothetical protein
MDAGHVCHSFCDISPFRNKCFVSSPLNDREAERTCLPGRNQTVGCVRYRMVVDSQHSSVLFYSTVLAAVDRLHGFLWIFSNSIIAQNRLFSTVTEESRMREVTKWYRLHLLLKYVRTQLTAEIHRSETRCLSVRQ